MTDLQVACIAPTEQIGLSSYGDYDFCLAHIAMTNVDYADYFKKQREKGRFVLLDNGAYETGEAIPDEVLLSLINKIKPSEVVAPDVFQDSIATSVRLEKFFKCYGVPIHAMGSRIMVVPQGRDIAEWTEHVKKLSDEYFFDTLGVPKWVAGVERRDDTLLRFGPGTLSKFEQIHLLGLYDVNELREFRVDIRSVDSKLPIKAAMMEKSFFDDDIPSMPGFFDETAENYTNATRICTDFVASMKALYAIGNADERS